MTDSELKILGGVACGAVGLYIKLTTLIDKKISVSIAVEQDKRKIRADAYKESFTKLNSEIDRFISKMVSLEGELKDSGGVHQKIYGLEKDMHAIQEAVKDIQCKIKECS